MSATTHPDATIEAHPTLPIITITREFDAEVRITNRQNLVFRNLTEEQLPLLFERLTAIGMAEPGAELSRDVVACPGADTCNIAVTQSRGLADAIGVALEAAGLGEVGSQQRRLSPAQPTWFRPVHQSTTARNIQRPLPQAWASS